MDKQGRTPDGDERQRESRRILDRVAAESESVGASALARAVRHLAASDAPPEDRIEVWGRRIGRTLGLVFAIYLVATLVEHFAR
ncbi:hypothetical protein NK718_09175 [Alsobacter sp. SYSU M60028]|uniref:Uncharacterized protein n=1 Tax=Alsobacter ponti TaxID=2962936 RepID=A0ABT1LB23_9HYPH|nr:hypothetical protein [Alsobacter ponti]MCP8938684.1 hypothetical protein [Alsobacter ponti]